MAELGLSHEEMEGLVQHQSRLKQIYETQDRSARERERNAMRHEYDTLQLEIAALKRECAEEEKKTRKLDPLWQSTVEGT